MIFNATFKIALSRAIKLQLQNRIYSDGFPLANRTAPMPLTKRNIIDAVAENNGYNREQAVQVTETLLEIIKRTLESGDDILISGFGKFCIQHKKPRMGRNPATDKPMKLRKRRIVTFRCSRSLRERINE